MKTPTSIEVFAFHFLRNSLALALSSALLACSGEFEEPAPSAVAEAEIDGDGGSAAVASNPAFGAARPSRSAAELADDYTQTLSYAREVADFETPVTATGSNPLAVVPTTPVTPTPITPTPVTPTPATPTPVTPAPATPVIDNRPSTTQSTELPLSAALAPAPEAAPSTPPQAAAETAPTPTETPTETSAPDEQVETAEPGEPDTDTSSPTPASNSTPTTQETTESDGTASAPASSAPAPGSTVDDTPDNTVGTEFLSKTTDGFVGQVLEDGTIKVSWNTDKTARGYNVYRQAEYVTTVFENEYIDTDVFDTNYYYEIQAFDVADNFTRIATGLTVKVRGLNKPDPNAPVANASLLQDYALVFSDEFDGNSLDTSKWNTAYLWGSELVINNEEQYYVDVNNDPDFGFNPFSFDGDSLTINSIKTPEELKPKAMNQPYLSGVITSYDSFKFTYGYVETRAKVPYGRGFWPAFWLLNAYYVDDKPEIDIMEFIGDDQDVVYHTYHYFDSNDELRSTKSAPTPGTDYTSDFHTYAVEWKPGTLVFYVDGVEQHRVVDPKVSQQEMYVIANTAIGGWWPGSPDNTTPFPAEYEIDYIRVYQKTTPYNDFVFDDLTTSVPPADTVPGSAPNHRPPYALWPEGYPDQQ